MKDNFFFFFFSKDLALEQIKLFSYNAVTVPGMRAFFLMSLRWGFI